MSNANQRFPDRAARLCALTCMAVVLCPPRPFDHLVMGQAPAAASDQDDAEQVGDASATQDAEIIDLELEDLMNVNVVVTASRRPERLAAVPHAISVITAKDIRLAGARTVPDALRLVPGMDVADLSFGNAAVGPRGLHGFLGRSVLVLVDGRQIFDSLFGGNLWGSWPRQVENIERIEVVRGPGGVSWGANAVDGVINIITKDPRDQLGTTFLIGAASRGTHRGHIGYAEQREKLRFRASVEYEGSDGFREGGSLFGRLEDDYKSARLDLHAVYETDPDDTWTFTAGAGVVDGGYPRTPLGGFELRRNPGSQALYVMTTWAHVIDKDSQFTFTGYINDFYASAGLPQIDYRYQQIALQFMQTTKAIENHILTLGVDTRIDLLDTGNSDPRMTDPSFIGTGIVGVYVQDDWRFAPKWSLGIGARLDYENYGGFQPSARLSISYAPHDGSMLYGAVSRAFQMPPAGIRFLELPVFNELIWVVSDRGVESEILMAYELGYRGTFLDRLTVGANLFWHEYDDRTTLSPELGLPYLFTLRVDNRASASMYGVDLNATWEATNRLTLLAKYTFQHLDWRSRAALHETDGMSPPRHKAMIGARYSPTDDVHLSGHLYYVDAVQAPNVDFPFAARRIDPYLRMDLRAEYEFQRDNASVAVGLRNLLDKDHGEGATLFLNYAESPRMVFAELRLRIP